MCNPAEQKEGKLFTPMSIFLAVLGFYSFGYGAMQFIDSEFASFAQNIPWLRGAVIVVWGCAGALIGLAWPSEVGNEEQET